MNPIKADLVLEEMARTFREKNKMYGDNYLAVGKVMQALFPNGITLKTEYDHILFHWISWSVGKLTRFVNSGMKDQNSIHDLAVYAAMIEDFITVNIAMIEDFLIVKEENAEK